MNQYDLWTTVGNESETPYAYHLKNKAGMILLELIRGGRVTPWGVRIPANNYLEITFEETDEAKAKAQALKIFKVTLKANQDKIKQALGDLAELEAAQGTTK